MARLLREAGVDMGKRFREPNGTNPDGFYEDLDFVDFNSEFLAGGLDLHQWRRGFELLVIDRQARGKPWGWKDPRTADVIQEVVRYFPEATYLRMRRDRAGAIASMRRCYGWSEDQAAHICDRREGNLDKHLPTHATDVPLGALGPGGKEYVAKFTDEGDRKPRLLVTVPNVGWVHQTVVSALLLMCQDKRLSIDVAMPSNKPYENNLGHIVRHCLKRDYDFWLNIDADNAPRKPKAALDLVFLNLDVVGLPTPVWRYRQENPWFINAMDEVPEKNTFRSRTLASNSDCNGLQEVGAVGSGCILVARRVLQKVQGPFMREWNDDGTVACGCDFAFCKRVRKAGFKVWAHYDHLCLHIKEIDIGQAVSACRGVFEKKGELLSKDDEDERPNH